jgi:hypothetical protein
MDAVAYHIMSLPRKKPVVRLLQPSFGKAANVSVGRNPTSRLFPRSHDPSLSLVSVYSQEDGDLRRLLNHFVNDPAFVL